MCPWGGVSPARHESASHMGRAFVSGCIPSHQRAHLGLLVFSTQPVLPGTNTRPMWDVSACIPFHPTRPARHEHASHMRCVFMSSYILSPPEHHQRARMGMFMVFRLVLLQADTKLRPMSGGFLCLLLPSALSPPATPSTQRPRHAIWVCFGLWMVSCSLPPSLAFSIPLSVPFPFCY